MNESEVSVLGRAAVIKPIGVTEDDIVDIEAVDSSFSAHVLVIVPGELETNLGVASMGGNFGAISTNFSI